MAAAAVATLLPLGINLIQLIAGLVHKAAPAAEAAHGPGTGPVKFAEVLTSVAGSLQKAFSAGQIGSIPDDNTLKTIVQSVVSALKLPGGVLADPPATTPAPPVVSPGTATLTIVGGTLQVQQS